MRVCNIYGGRTGHRKRAGAFAPSIPPCMIVFPCRGGRKGPPVPSHCLVKPRPHTAHCPHKTVSYYAPTTVPDHAPAIAPIKPIPPKFPVYITQKQPKSFPGLCHANTLLLTCTPPIITDCRLRPPPTAPNYSPTIVPDHAPATALIKPIPPKFRVYITQKRPKSFPRLCHANTLLLTCTPPIITDCRLRLLSLITPQLPSLITPQLPPP